MNKLTSYSFIIVIILSMSACSILPQRSYSKNNRAITHTPTQQKPQHRATQHRVSKHKASKPRVTSQRQTTSRPQVASQKQRAPRPQINSQQAPRQSPAMNIHPARLRMINIAQSTLGAPYKWGGNSPQRGFDCSGLTSYVYKNATGIKIPRTTANQRDQSRTINYAQLQAGDMLFFKTGSKTNHVGIYVGNRKFIHAPSSGKRVTVATMDSSYWHKRFVKFGTFFN